MTIYKAEVCSHTKKLVVKLIEGTHKKLCLHHDKVEDDVKEGKAHKKEFPTGEPIDN